MRRLLGGWQMRSRLLAIGMTLALVAGAMGATASAQMAPASVGTMEAGDLGTVLTAANGMTVYVFTRDQPGVSSCYDACAVTWPPLLTETDPVAPEGLVGSLGTTTRRDGKKQVTYNGWPLYFFARDTAVGQTNGQNVGTIWFVVSPAEAPDVQVRQQPALGPILVDERGWTLYAFDRDQPGVSNCYEACAVTWPPLLTDVEPWGTEAVAAGLGWTTRNDGTTQITYNGWPLYYFARDTMPSDVNGQGVGGIWWAVTP
jgi:predicted lipoprotein with Yx(FWY)xxD motif